MSNYIINLGNDGTVNGTVELSLTELDSTSTDLKLVGSMAVGYGLAHAENFAKLLTNFASSSVPPSRPKQGQIWYNASDKGLKLYTNTGWVDIYSAGATVATPLSIAQGGTGRTTAGAPLSILRVNGAGTGLEYVSADLMGTGYFVKTNSDSEPTVNDMWSIGSPTLKFKNIYATSFKGKADSAFTADTASSVPWSGVTSKPTTMAGLGITDGVDKNYVDTGDYLNFSPQAGYLFDNKVPVSSSFDYSLGSFNQRSYLMIDGKGRQNLFYHTTDSLRRYFVFRAWRYSSTEPFIFDNEQVSAPFLSPNEKIARIYNVGLNFVFARIMMKDTAQTHSRWVIIKTNGSSDWSDWTLGYTVDSLFTGSANFALVPTASGDRIIKVSIVGSFVTLSIYDQTLTLLREFDVYSNSELNITDTTGAGRVVGSGLSFASYADGVTIAPFSWNPVYETFHLVAPGWYTYSTSAGQVVGQPYSISLAWKIPKSYIENGTGTCQNLVTIKSGSYRYNKLKDSTWNTDTGGMSDDWVAAGLPSSLYSDEFTGDMFLFRRGTWTSGALTDMNRQIPYLANTPPITWASNLESRASSPTGYVGIPDGSPWSKALHATMHVIGDNIQFEAESSKYGSKTITTTFSTTQFKSTQSGETDDTLVLDSVNAVVSSGPSGLALPSWGQYGTVVIGSTPTYYALNSSRLLHTITASGITRTYTSTGITVPTIPATIGAQTGLTGNLLTSVMWNGSTASPIFWSPVSNAAGLHMAKCVGGAWSLSQTMILASAITNGNNNRGDTTNQIYITGSQPLLTASGRYLFVYIVPHTGGSAWGLASYDVTTDTISDLGWTKFAPTGVGVAGKFGGPTPYPNSCFGYSTTLGYFHTQAVNQYEAVAIVSSRDVRTGTTYSENDWFNNTGRSQIWMTVEATTGLVAYVSAYPIFLGGYFTTVPSTTVALNPNTTNYIYATRATGTDKTVTVSVSSTKSPSGNSRVLLAEVTTDGTKVLSQKSYVVARHDRVEDLSNVEIGTKTPGDLLSWDGEKWTTTQGVAGATGGGSDKVFYENDNVVTADYTITANKNAMSAGPITINSGVTITIPPGSSWTIV